jgi:hypothetical protein
MENARIVFISSLELVGYCFGLSPKGRPTMAYRTARPAGGCAIIPWRGGHQAVGSRHLCPAIGGSQMSPDISVATARNVSPRRYRSDAWCASRFRIGRDREDRRWFTKISPAIFRPNYAR